MVRLISPNGSEIEAREDAVDGLLSLGFNRADDRQEVEKPKPKTRKSTSKAKED